MANGSTTANTTMAVADVYNNNKGSVTIQIGKIVVTGCTNINSTQGMIKEVT